MAHVVVRGENLIERDHPRSAEAMALKKVMRSRWSVDRSDAQKD